MMKDQWKLVCKIAQAAFAFSCVAVFAAQLALGHVRAPLGLVGLLFLFIPYLARVILRIRMDYKLKTLVFAFSLIAFNLGVAMDWYKAFGAYSMVWCETIFGYDKLMHLLSGVLFTLMGLCFFSRILNEESDPFENPGLRVTYAIGFSMGIAVGWEIFEFLGFLLFGHDAQHHLDSGVLDTMGDLIACVLGSLYMALDYALCVRKERRSFLVGCMLEFIELNPKKRKKPAPQDAPTPQES